MKILAIDDNRDNLTTLKAIVQDVLPACTLLTALNGTRGIELALAEDPDVILLDIVMPGMDGYQVCRRLKADEQSRPIPVVFLTALRTDRDSRIKALDAGAEAFLAKPLDEQELVATVRSMAKVKEANCRLRSESERLTALVAERTRALELELSERRKAEEKYHGLFREMIDAFALHDIICDEAGKPIDYRFLAVNPAFERMTGLTAKDVIGRTVMDVMPRTERHWIETYGRVALTGQPAYFESYAIEMEKHFAVAAFRPSPNQFACTFIDITQRKRAEAAAAREHVLSKTIVDSIPGAFYMLDEKGAYVRWNAYQRDEIVGKPEDQVAGTSALDTIHPDDREFIQMKIASVLGSDREATVEARVLLRGGPAFRWLLLTGRPMTIEGSRFLVGIGIDITERKLAEDAQKQAERRYRDLFEQANEGLLLMTTDGQLTQINNVFVEMHGYNAEDFKAKSITDLDVLKERTLEDRAEIIRRMNAGETVRFEVEHYHKDGHVFPIAVSTRLITLNGQPFYLSSHSDITEHKLAQKALQQAQAILQAAMDQSTAGIAIADAPGGELRYVNDAGLLIRGGARETVVNGIGINQYVASWKILDFDGRPLRADEVPLSRAIMFGETCSRDFIIRRAEGDDRVVLAKAAPIRDESGKIVAGIVVFMDITEARRTEQEKEKLHSQLAQAQKLESIGRLAGGVAHDFNNLLMGMLNYVELCRDKLPPEHPIRPFLAEITSDANRSADLTRQLLAFARKQTIAPRVLDMNDAVGDMRKLLGRLLGENISLTWSPCPALWKVKLDPAQVDQILANLCVNARDAIAGVGRLNIETCNVTADEPYCAGHADAVPGEYVLLTVSDTGHGMSKEVLSHIFEPFFTTKELGKGTGLGLATVFGIVTQNKGFITVYSEPGKGTAFKIHLPRCAAPAPEAQIAETPTKPPRGTETILLVEDEKSVRVTTKLFLEDLGYKVLVADHPGKALTLAAQHPDEIHLLITDVIMPNMSGSDLAGKLCSARPSLKRLFISGFTADIIAKEGVLESSMHFLTKPFGRDVLARKVREVLEGNEK